MSRSLLDKVIRLCESRGFSIESSVEAMLGTAGGGHIYEFGPLGTELIRNLRNAWWHHVVLSKSNVYGFEANWGKLSHLSSLSALQLNNGKDHVNKISEPISKTTSDRCSISEEGTWTSEDINKLIQLVSFIPGIKEPFGFASNKKYINWKPRSENYLLRSCEKEVMSLQFFCLENRVNDWLNYWKRQRLVWWRKFANIRSNYSLSEDHSNLEPGVNSRTFIQYAFPWGKEEVDCLTVRSDLCNQMTIQQHGKLPFDKESTPHVIQITSDLNAGFLSFLMDAYLEKDRSDDSGNVAMRAVLHLHPQLAPVKIAIFPQRQQRELSDVARQTSAELQEAGINTQCLLRMDTNADESYAYQDEIGTPYCVTILDTTLNNGIVAFRSRNTTLQEFMHVSDVLCTVKKHLGIDTTM